MRNYLFALVFGAPILAVPSCATTGEQLFIGGDCDSGFCDAGPTVGFDPAADGGDAAASHKLDSTGMCPTNECPPGRATCPSNPFPCAVDYLTDSANCGKCGNKCPASFSCVDGACVLSCASEFADCNGYVEDGCEARITSDKNNCGSCGVICAAPFACSNGECTCPITRSCGACGNICPPPDANLPPFPKTWNAEYSCVDSTCNQPNCKAGYTDCNHDFPQDPAGNGCETLSDSDPNNCGKCGTVCAVGEVCTRGECKCACGSVCFKKLEYDPLNCGTCGFFCPSVSNADTICDHGMCDYQCTTGHADCDHDSSNGCETNTLSDPLNCGGCGHRCDGVDGQACVDGQCTETECGIR